MKRTPPWVFVAAVAVQLAALGLCVFAMEHWGRVAEAPEAEAEPEPPSEEPPSPRGALAAAPPLAAADVAFARAPQPPTAPAPSGAAPQTPVPRRNPEPVVRPVQPPEPADAHVATPPPPVAQTAEPPPRPLFGPPPERDPDEPVPPAASTSDDRIVAPPEHRNGDPAAPIEYRNGDAAHPQTGDLPRFGTAGPTPFQPRFDRPAPAEPPAPSIPEYITEVADGTTQLVTGVVEGRPVTFGFYPDGNIRYVDVDGGRYAGKAESARARMREVEGTRAFTVQIGVAADGRLQATFTGGLHDAATFPLEPLVGWSVA